MTLGEKLVALRKRLDDYLPDGVVNEYDLSQRVEFRPDTTPKAVSGLSVANGGHGGAMEIVYVCEIRVRREKRHQADGEVPADAALRLVGDFLDALKADPNVIWGRTSFEAENSGEVFGYNVRVGVILK